MAQSVNETLNKISPPILRKSRKILLNTVRLIEGMIPDYTPEQQITANTVIMDYQARVDMIDLNLIGRNEPVSVSYNEEINVNEAYQTVSSEGATA